MNGTPKTVPGLFFNFSFLIFVRFYCKIFTALHRKFSLFQSWFDRIRYYKELTGDIETAIDMAIREMSEESVIKSFLMNHKAEVKHMCITEYDEVKTMNMFKEEGREEGNLSAIKNMIKNLKLSAQQAMDALDIPTAEQQRYLKML